MKVPSSRRAPSATGKIATVEEYLAATPEPARSTLNKVRAAIRSVVPAGTTEVISYGMPGFRSGAMLVWYAAFSDHCSFFPTAVIMEQFKEELKKYRKSKGTLLFPLDKPLPSTLVKKMVKARIAYVASKKRR